MRSEAERGFHASVEDLHAIMDMVPLAVFLTRDPQCNVLLGNRAAYDLLRVPRGTNLSKTGADAERLAHFRVLHEDVELAPEDIPVHVAARTGKPVHDFEVDIVFADGSVRHALCIAEPLLDAAGQPRGAVQALLDITERKKIEERLHQTQRLESVGMLAGGIAHDFNNLLVGILGNAGLAREVLPPDNPAAPLLDRVIDAGEQAARLTRELLAYAGKGRFVIEPVDIAELVRTVAVLMRSSLARTTRLDLDLAPDLPPLRADRAQLQQLITNLLVNASEAIHHNNGVIAVRAAVETAPDGARFIRLEFRDNGCGMDDATRARLFDPFFSTKFMGRGLGLPAVSGIVRGHRGTISVESKLGAGSRFIVLLPVQP